MLRKTKLNSIESIISKEIQNSNTSEKHYLFIKEEVNRYDKPKEKIRKKVD